MSVIEALASSAETKIAPTKPSCPPPVLNHNPDSPAAAALRLPVRVRDHRFKVHDGIIMQLGAEGAEIRLRPGVDMQRGDTLTVMMELRHSGCEQAVVRQAQVLETAFHEAIGETGGKNDGLYLRTLIRWDHPLPQWLGGLNDGVRAYA